MPGFGRWHPNEESFNYTKLCFYYIPYWLVFLGIAAMFISAFGGLQWLDRLANWLPSSTLWRVALGIGLIAGYYLFFIKIVWGLLPVSVRARIPYDAREARESKGDIKSFWDLRRLVVRTRS